MSRHRISTRKRCRFFLYAAASAALAPRGAADSNWNAASGLWSIAGNWNPIAVPGPNVNVNIVNNDASSRVISFDYNYPVGGTPIAQLNLYNSGSGIDTLSLGGNRLATVSFQSIGGSGRGTVNHSGGTNFVGGDLRLGQFSTGIGIYNLSNTASLTVAGHEYIGETGSGMFNQTGGTHSNNSDVVLGVQTAGSGTATLSGGTWFVGGDETIGNLGRGTFTQSGGTHTAGADLYLAHEPASSGNAMLSNGTWSVTGAGFLGYRGNAVFNQSGGAFSAAQINLGDQLSATAVYNQSNGSASIGAGGLNIAYNPGVTGTWSMSNNASLAVTGNENIGLGGSGTFNQTGGLHTDNSDLYLGRNFNSTGRANLSGGTWSVAGNANLAYSGNGTFNQSGGTFSASSMILAYGNGIVGLFNQTGGVANIGTNGLHIGELPTSAGTWSMSNNARLNVDSEESIGVTGDGVFNQTGGTHNSQRLLIGVNAFSSGTARLSGGAWTTGEAILGRAGAATFFQSGGTFTAERIALGDGLNAPDDVRSAFNLSGGTVNVGAGGLFIAYYAAAVGTWSMSNSATLSVAGGEAIGYSNKGTFNQTGGSNSCVLVTLGELPGSSGTVNFSGGTWSTEQGVNIGIEGRGTFNQSGGTLTANLNSITVGGGGVGAFNLTGGTVNALGVFGLTIAGGPDSTGAWTMSGSPTLNAQSEILGARGQASFVQSGGSNTVTFALTIGQSAGSSGTATLSGGTWTVGDLVAIGYNGDGLFNQAGGTFRANAGIELGSGPSSHGALYVSGGALITPFLNIGVAGPSSVTLQAGTMTAGAVKIFPAGTLNVSGGAFIYTSLTNSGTLNVTTNLQLGPLDLLFGSVTRVDANLTVTGNLNNLSAAPILGAGQLLIRPTATYTGSGLIMPSVSNAGHLTVVGGALLLNGPAFNNSGTVLCNAGTRLFIEATAVTNTGNITVNTAAALTFRNAALSNPSNRAIVLAGGALTATSILNSGTISGSGQIAAGLTNTGSLTINGPTQLYGNLLNNAAGRITLRNSQFLVLGAATNNGTITLQAGGSAVFDGGLSGNPVGGPVPVPAGDTTLQPSSALLASFMRQSSLSLSGNPGDPSSFAKAAVRPKAQGGDTSVLTTFSIQTDGSGAPLGRLDLADTALILNYSGPSPLASVRDQIIAAYAPAAPSHWSGTGGITSSAAAADASKALGYAEAAEILGPGGGTFQGQAADGTSVLVRYTLPGDANLDGIVDFNDLVRLAQNYNTNVSAITQSWWTRGDFNYDGKVDFNDLVKLAQNYNTALPTDAIPGASSSFNADFAAALVPEPSTSILPIAACGLAGKRRRRNRLVE